MTPEIRVRFAPSPTGYLHVGGARTALFNWLFARASRGTFILRIEDTDQTRYDEAALVSLLDSLHWLGLEWDEGPEVGGPCGPYFQSQRLNIYRQHAEQLLGQGHAYRCFCPPERLQKLREEQEKAKLAQISGYDRHCRTLSADEQQRLLAEGKPSVVRLKVPLGRKVVFTDMIRGEIECESDVIDDVVLLKTDGFPTYHLANVVDDHLMRISHVMRGDEWISSMPRHILLYEAFGWDQPRFAHMPVILSPDGGKLSKRKGAVSVTDYRSAGYLPEALFNFLALLGWSPGDDREKMSREEMIAAFSLDRVIPKAAVFDGKKLDWMNGLYLRECDVDHIYEDVVQRWSEVGLLGEERLADELYLRTVIRLMKDRSRTLAELAGESRYFFVNPETYEEKAVAKHFRTISTDALQELIRQLDRLDPFDHAALEQFFNTYAASQGISVGKLIHPTRLAVTGVSYGPGLFELLEVLGKETSLRRMKAALEWLSDRHNDQLASQSS